VPGDHAIHSRNEDRLGRGPFVASLAQAVRQLDASQGVVIGLTGSWGLGKTSVLNMLTEELDREPRLVTVTFEPWLFSGTDELISLFFADLSEQLQVKLPKGDKLIELIDTYGQSLGMLKWVPVAGPWLDRAGSVFKLFNKAASKRLEEARKVTSQRERLSEVLARRSDPIVVIIDDLDRLRPYEVRDIVQLVRLTGQFPNLIYILAFDRERVETMLTEVGFEGREYLEKIIEISYHLPPVPRAALEAVLTSELNELVEPLETGPFDQDRWAEVFHQCLRPLFTDLRDVRRYLAALPAMLTAIGMEVALVDVLALEALRVLQPDAYRALTEHCALLTRVSTAQGEHESRRGELDAITAAVPDDDAAVRQAVSDMLRLLFPAIEQYIGGSHYDETWSARWRRERRTASIHVLNFYLEKTLGPGIAPAGAIDRIVESLPNEASLRAALGDVDDQMLEDVLERLEAYESQFPADAVEPAVIVLLGLYPRMRPARGPFDLDGDQQIDRVVLRLLRASPDAPGLASMIARIADGQPSLYARMKLLRLVSHAPGAGAKLIPEDEANRLVGDLWSMVRGASAHQLVSEPHLATLLYHAVRDNPDERETLDELLGDPEVFAALLRDALDSVRSWPVGGVVAKRQPTLRWDTLIGIFGDEQNLADNLDEFRNKAGKPLLADEAIALALDLATLRLQAGPPTAQWDHPATTSQPMSSHTRDILRVNDDPRAQLILRSAVMYTASPASIQKTTLLSSKVHDTLRRRLSSGEMIDAALAYCYRHSLPLDLQSQSETESDNANHLLAVVRRTITAPNSPTTVTVRAALVSPSQNESHVRVIAEVWVALASPAERPATAGPEVPKWTPILSVVETRDLLAGALGTASGIGSDDLPTVYGDNVLPHVSTEVHVILGNPVQTDAAPNVSDLIDLEPLGTPVSIHKARDGDYGAGADVPIGDRDRRVDLVNDALRYMSGPVWRYPDADARLLDLLRAPSSG
jgi:predicted KAP-like P-loop ATPase